MEKHAHVIAGDKSVLDAPVPEGYVGIRSRFEGNYTPDEVGLASKLLNTLLEEMVEGNFDDTRPLGVVSCFVEMVNAIEDYVEKMGQSDDE